MMSGLDLNPRSSHVAACDASGGYFSVGPAGTSETGRRSSHAAAAAPEVPHRGGGLMIINTLLSNGVSVVRPASRKAALDRACGGKCKVLEAGRTAPQYRQ